MSDFPTKTSLEVISGDQMNFIPEVELDEFGQPKKRPFKQKKYEPLTDYGG